MTRTIKTCNCGYANKFGYSAWAWRDKLAGNWKYITNHKTVKMIEEAIKKEKRVLVKCDGCGEEMLREY